MNGRRTTSPRMCASSRSGSSRRKRPTSRRPSKRGSSVRWRRGTIRSSSSVRHLLRPRPHAAQLSSCGLLGRAAESLAQDRADIARARGRGRREEGEKEAEEGAGRVEGGPQLHRGTCNFVAVSTSLIFTFHGRKPNHVSSPQCVSTPDLTKFFLSTSPRPPNTSPSFRPRRAAQRRRTRTPPNRPSRMRSARNSARLYVRVWPRVNYPRSRRSRPSWARARRRGRTRCALPRSRHLNRPRWRWTTSSTTRTTTARRQATSDWVRTPVRWLERLG
jgi:hypothetical protein